MILQFQTFFRSKLALLLVAGVVLPACLLMFKSENEPDLPVSVEVFPAEEALPIAAVEEVQEPLEPKLNWKEGSLKRPFYDEMSRLGFSGEQIQTMVDSLSPLYDFRKARPEHKFRVGFEGEKAVCLTLEVSGIEIYDMVNLDSEPKSSRREVRTYMEQELIRGEIENSLFGALGDVPGSAHLAVSLAKVFAWDVDFYKDPRKGDKIEMLVESRYYINDQGTPVFHGYGNILAARYLGATGNYEAFYFETEDGEPGYYNAEGKSLVREVLRSPLKFQRITSRFNRNRFHPVLKTRRPHRGVDYGAPRNTPVMAVASGRVVTSGRMGGAGIAVEIQHRNKILTQYFHLNKIADGVHKGARVKQGQVIGYVGKTGLASGYHLHYGMKINGSYVDPLQQKFPPSTPVPQNLKEDFRQTVMGYMVAFDPSVYGSDVLPIVRVDQEAAKVFYTNP